MSLRPRAAIVGGSLRQLRSGGAARAVMKRTRAVLAALPARFGRRLPACTLRHRTLGEREHASDRRDPSQERSHTFRMRRRGQRVKLCQICRRRRVESFCRLDSLLAMRSVSRDGRESRELTARGESLAAFDGRCIPAPPQRGCRVGAPPLAVLLLPQILPIFSVVAPCLRGASPVSMRRQTCTTGC